MGKMCSRCRRDDVEFGPNARRRDGLAVYCRGCTKEYMAAKNYDAERWASHREQESARYQAYRERCGDDLRAKERERANDKRQSAPAQVRAWNISRKHGEKRATPVWADRPAMNAVYAQAKVLQNTDGVERHVDHDVPLKHPLVCGLHVSANLVIRTALENMRKHNKFEVA